ncbi:MAG: hypothetical protein ACXVB0_17850 [Mucilaginibacter sp.]
MGINKNWIVVTGNLFSIGDGPKHDKIYVFNKKALYSGQASPVVFDVPESHGFTIAPATTCDNTTSTMYMVSTWNTNVNGNGYLRLYTITGDADNPVYKATETYPSVNTTWNYLPNSNENDFSPQKDVTQLFQNNDSRMQSVIYRNGFLWCTHTAFLPTNSPTHSVVQWYQIDVKDGSIIQFGRIEDRGSSNTHYYAFPSIAVNKNNDVLIGYASFSNSQFASADYSFRFGSDPVGQLRSSQEFRNGMSKYYKTFRGTENRWGDYSSTCVDPDDTTLWALQQYAESQPDMWGTQWVSIHL